MPRPLAPQTIDVPFGFGLDNNTDDRNVLPGKLVTLENGFFDKRGRITKRPGIIPFSGFGSAVGKLAGDDNFLYLRDSTTTDETIRGPAGSTVRTVRNYVFPRLVGAPIASPISIGATGNMQTVDLTLDQVGKRLGLGVFTDTANAIGLTAIDYTTMLPLVTEIQSITGKSARVLPRGTTDKFILGVHDGTNIKIYDNVTTSGSTLATGGGFAFVVPAASVTIGTVNATPYWDWFVLGTTLFVVYLDTAGTTLTIAKYTIGTWTPTTQTLAVASVQSVTVAANTTANLAAVFVGTATNIRCATFNATTLAAVTAAFTIYSPAIVGLVGWEQITGVVTPTRLYFAAQASTGANAWQKQVHWVFDFTQNSAATTATSLVGLSLASKMSSDLHAACVFDTLLQRQLLFYRYDEGANTTLALELCGRIFYGSAGAAPQNKCLPQAVDLSRDGTNLDLIIGCTVSQASTASATTQTRMFTMGYAEAQKPGQRAYPQAKINGRAYFGGGFLHNVSANGMIPTGFFAYPENVTFTAFTSGGSLADGVYGGCFTVEWTDETGEVHESAPSPIVTATVTGGGGAGRIDFTTFVQFGDVGRQQGRVPCFLVVYRTVAGGTHLYREKRVAYVSGTALQGGSCTLVASTLSQFAINASAEGAETEAAQPDCPIAIAGDVDRMWVVPGSAPNTVVPSKPKLQGIGLEFFGDVYRVVSPSGDRVTAIARCDGKIIAFKSVGCFLASGDGPDATGANDSLGQFNQLFLQIGAEAHNAVVTSNLGVYTKNAQDIWFIGRDLQLARVGMDVENYTALPLRSAVNVDTLREVRFLLGDEASNCTELVFDEDQKQWSLSPRAANAGTRPTSLVYNGVLYYYLGNAFYTESPTTFADNGVGYSLKLVTAWLKPAQIMQGFARVWRALLIGDSFASHTLQVRVRYDYEAAWSETHTITSAAATTADGVWQPEVMLIRQRCEAIQFEISDITPTGQAFALSGLELEVGVIPGMKRQRAEKRM